MNVTTRPATMIDLPEILNIVNHAILHTTSNYHYEIQTIESQTAWFSLKTAHDFPVIVASVNDCVVGFASYGTFREKIGYQHTVEHSVYVHHEFQAKGIGKILLQEMIDIAKMKKIHVMIGCIDADNTSSIAFHHKFGFKTTGILPQVAFKFDRWLDLVIVQLNLP